jgi:hypothetical protein
MSKDHDFCDFYGEHISNFLNENVIENNTGGGKLSLAGVYFNEFKTII